MKTLVLSSILAAAALFTAVPGAVAQKGSGAFCLQRGSGEADCSYQTMAQCEAAKQGVNPTGTCAPNSQTQGQGGIQRSPSSPMTSPSPSR